MRLTSQGQELGSAPLSDGDCSITVRSDGYTTSATVGEQQLAQANADVRPQLTGIYSDLDAAVDDVDGVSFEAEVDNRWDSSATPLKIAAIALALLGFVGSLIALRGFDARAARQPRRFTRPGRWKPTARDVVVVVVLLAWWLIGAMTADDGYFLTMSRLREEIGYVSDFYRWFAAPVAPMGWFVDVYSLWVQVSTATPWVRLPALIMGVVSWLLISRVLLVRLGQRVRRSSAAGWAAAAVFLAAWLPYNNGLRPEPVVVLFALLALCCVERTVATGRLVPAAWGLVAAALGVAANPHGLVAVLPFIAAIKPLLRLLRRRASQFGWLPVLAPLAACGLVILTLIFWDQTWQGMMDAKRLQSDIGPAQDWYEEFSRYALLFSESPDGSLSRRFPVLLVILCLVTCAVMLLRHGQIRGAALGPSRRMLAVAGLYFVALALTPTKHTHHFGVLAAVGGCVAALTALATSSTVLRSRRNRAWFFAGLMAMLAFAFTGTNAWWYASGWGVPWFDKPPSIQGFSASTLLLIIAAIATIVGFVEHLRLDERNPDVTTEESGRALRRGTAPLSIVCALLMVFEVASLAKVVPEQADSYSLGQDNIQQLNGSSRGLSDSVYAERNPQEGMLAVASEQPTAAAPDTDVPQNGAEEERPDDYLRAKMEGFNRPGLPPSDTSSGGDSEDWTPPHRFGTDRAPVWGSYDPAGASTGQLRTQWYDLPERATSGEVPIVLNLAGPQASNATSIEFGRDTPEGFEIMHRAPVEPHTAKQWWEHRVSLDGKAQGATQMRVVANDQAIGPNGWLAVSAPRAPQLTLMTDVVGAEPTFVEWTAAFVHPQLNMTGIRNGIADIPRYRVAAGDEVRDVGQAWSSPDAGGPFGWLNVATSMRELPTYLKNDVDRDWGSLYEVHPYEPDALPAEAAMEVRSETHSGMWTPGPTSQPIELPGDIPRSDDRSDIPLSPPGGDAQR